MSAKPTLLKVLLSQQHRQKYETFCAEYERAAREVAPELARTAPSKAQYYRWLSGQLRGGTPYPDACRVLEQMFPEWTAAELFAECPAEQLPKPGRRPISDERLPDAQYADVIGIFTSRAEFTAKMPASDLLDGAADVRAVGLSLNMICQQYPDQRLCRMIEGGTAMRCLFLDPHGEAIRVREREEGHPEGLLSTSTEVNIRMLTERVRDRLSPEARARLEVGVYDETVRFNIVLVDGTGVIQPYLPEARGVDSPTLVVERQDGEPGLYTIFAQVFDSLWERSKPL